MSTAFAWIPLVLLAVATIVILRRSEPVARWKYWLLAPLPLLWIFVGLWGGLFWLDWERTPMLSNPDWVGFPVLIAFCIYLAISAGLIVYLRGIRWFTMLFAALNLYFMLAMVVQTSMAIHRAWL